MQILSTNQADTALYSPSAGAHAHAVLCSLSPCPILYLRLQTVFLQVFHDIQREKTLRPINGVMGIKECLWQEVETGSTVGEDEESSR